MAVEDGMMHIGLFPFAVASMNLSPNVTTLEDSSRIRALTTKKSITKPPAIGKKSSIRWVAETTFRGAGGRQPACQTGTTPIAQLDPREMVHADGIAREGSAAKGLLALISLNFSGVGWKTFGSKIVFQNHGLSNRLRSGKILIEIVMNMGITLKGEIGPSFSLQIHHAREFCLLLI
jgi:hypothetical protein